MKRILLLPLITIANYLSAQEILVNSFDAKPFYEQSNSEIRKDGNGNACALVNVYFTEKNACFEGNYVVGSSAIGESYQVHLAEGASRMVVKHTDYLPTSIVFSDYGIKKLESSKVYDLTLIADKTDNAFKIQNAVGDYETRANEGDADAQYNLGKKYYLGLNYDQDYEKAIYWFKKSADQGNINAIYNLGLCFYNGQGIEQDYHSAKEYFKKAAENGHAMAQFKYANCLYLAQGVQETNIEEAMKWYEKAASQNILMAKNNVSVIYLCYDPTNYLLGTSDVKKIGFPDYYEKGLQYLKECEAAGLCEAYLNLGNVYSDGIVVKKDEKKAFDYYQKGVENGYYACYNSIGRCYSYGIGVKQDEKKALENFKIAAQKGVAEGCYSTALCYQFGKGTKQNMKMAVNYYQKAVNQHLALAETNLANLYENGIGVNKDLNKAYDLYLQAAKDGDPNGYANIGTMYLSGQYVKRDINKAIDYYEKAANKGNYAGLINLAIMYQTGNGVPLDGNKAVSYYERACLIDKTGSAVYNLGTLYYSGCGAVRQNYQKAFECFKKSADVNYAPAQYNLGVMYLNGQYVNKDQKTAIAYIGKAAKQKYQPATEYMNKVKQTRMENILMNVLKM